MPGFPIGWMVESPTRVFHSEGRHGGHPPHPMTFFENPPSKLLPLMGHLPHLKVKPPPLKSKAPFQEMIPRKKPKNLETVINTCVSIIKQQMAEIPQKCDSLTWSIQNFIRKVKQFVRKYITLLINLANKLYDVEKFLDFILCHVLLKIALFY